MIKRARERNQYFGGKENFLVGSGNELPYPAESFDLVVAIGYIEYFDNPGITINEIRRVLKPEGILVMQSFKWEFFGNLKRFVTQPVRSVFRRRNRSANANLPPDWIDKKYSQRQLDQLLREHDFIREDYNYNNFYVFNFGLRLKYPNLYIRLSEAMSRSSPNVWRFFAANYIGRYRLEKS